MSNPARNQAIAKVKVGAKALALTDDTYRAVLKRITGKESCGDMTAPQLAAVIEHFKGLGAYRRQVYTKSQPRMVRGLWMELYELGEVRDRSDKALDAFVARQCGVSSARFLIDPDQARPVIEALKAMLKRAKARRQAG